MRTAADLRVRLMANVHAAATAAMHADNDVIQQAVDELATGGRLDEHTNAFLRRAHQLVIGLTAALNAVLDTHRELRDQYGVVGCRECDTSEAEACRTLRRIADIVSLYSLQRLPFVDAAEAFRRARLHYTDRGESGQLVTSVEEITGAYVVRHLRLDPPPPPAAPTAEGERVLIVDQASGLVTIWPLMPLAEISLHYQRYKRGQSPTSVDPAGG